MQFYIDKFKALADETRLRILSLLLHSNAELCVCEMTDALEIPQYNISRHLKVLKSAGLVGERKEGRWVYFSVIRDTDDFTTTILAAIRKIPESKLSKDMEELEKRFALRTGGKCLLGIQKKYLLSSRLEKT